MTKKNQTFSWRNVRDEELGFHNNGNSQVNVGSSGTKDDHRESSHTDANNPPQQGARIQAGSPEVMQLGYSRTEVSNNRALANDELYITSNEHPGMTLTTDVFDGSNFYNWQRSVKRGLISRNKLGLVDGAKTSHRISGLYAMVTR
ncbi:hypothetical protein C2S52_007105 [Perilla frutescens var. hirtella]|nr:hypothetical protein C2S51_008751 [Perilla frutescens var. frutescens]KAH6787553.1 hypothetical protein C2S52_007105 [Perilla frutescens var. hirtella]